MNEETLAITLPRIKIEEGYRRNKYLDTEGFLTIGYGLNVDAGVIEPVASAALEAQVRELDTALSIYGWYTALDPARQSAVLDIAFNEGFERFVNTWPKLIAALTAQDWPAAQAQCRTKTIEDQPRYTHLGLILLTGQP